MQFRENRPFNFRNPFIWLFVAVCFISCKKPSTIYPKEKGLVEAVYASGYVIPVNEQKITAQTDGTFHIHHVHAGDAIRKGQLLFTITNEGVEARLEAARQNLSFARENAATQSSPTLSDLKVALNNARAQVQHDSLNFYRYQTLWEENVTSKIAADNARIAYINSRNQYRRLREQYQLRTRQLSLDVENARAQVASARTEQSNYEIRSNVNGILYNLYKDEGDWVRRYDPIALAGSSGSLYLQLSIDENDFDKIKTGQTVMVKAEAFPDKFYRAQITRIFPMIQKDNQSFRADASLIEQFPKSVAYTSLEANIIIAQKDRVLTIPRSYLLNNDSVIVIEGRKKMTKAVKTGIMNMDEVEIISGIDKNTQLVNPVE